MILKAKQILSKTFGYKNFRTKQLEIIESVLDGQDTLALMPTGGGKSICFQIPALLFDGITIVVSPLISLMKDQVEALKANGIAAEYLNSSLSAEEESLVKNMVFSNQVKLLYMSPERLLNDYHLWLKDITVSLVAIDEAHCVSMWGHDFRPEYVQLKDFRESIPHVPFIALTATADKTTRKDIINQIGLKNPKVSISSFDRKNLSLEVRSNIKKKQKIKELISFINKHSGESGIIYCLSRKGTEEMTEELKKHGLSASSYHAGLANAHREKVQEDFINDRTTIICATIAFGMGIDKSNVRWVVHNNLPKNIESYYQEIGRAGRDGLPSDTILYYNLRDLMVLKQFTNQGEQGDLYTEKLQRMLYYAQAKSCRRQILLSYFGEHLYEKCGNCDICKNPPEVFDGTVLAQKALSALFRLEEKVGINSLINVLRGSKNQEILSKRYDRIKTYGVGADIAFRDWQQYITQLINVGAIEIAYDESFALKITDFGNDILYGKRTVHLIHPIQPKKETKEKRTQPKLEDNSLFDALKALRLKLAKKSRVPAYVIFHDATLKDMANNMPQNKAEMVSIDGISDVKFAKYGADFINEIQKYSGTKGTTYEQTLDLYNKNLSVEEIGRIRNLKSGTIISHLCKLYELGHAIDLRQFVTDDELKVLKKVLPQSSEEAGLKTIYDQLDGKIDYPKIKIGLILLDNQ